MKTNLSEEKLNSHIPSLLSVYRGNSSVKQLSPSELAQVSSSLLKLQRGLTGDRKLAGAGYMEDKSFLGAYLLYYWPVSYLQISYAFRSLGEKNYPESKNGTFKVLDVGSGPGPAGIAVSDILRGSSKDKVECTLIDFSAKALSLAKKLYSFCGYGNGSSAGAKGGNVSVRDKNVSVQDKNPRTFTADFEKGKLPVAEDEKFDVIVMSHALNELWRGQKDFLLRRKEFVEELTSHLSEDGVILLCEPALLETSRSLIAVRDMLVQEGLDVVSPCPMAASCPALTAGENHTCHAEIDWKPCEPVYSIAKAAHLDRESVKMTYFILRRKNGAGAAAVTIDTSAAGNSYRVVSDGMLNKAGRIRYLLCDGNRRIALSAKKDDPKAKSLGFFNLKRYDSVMLENPEVRGDKDNPAFGIKEDTNLLIESTFKS